MRDASVSQWWYEAVLTWFGAVYVDTWRDDVQYVAAACCHVDVDADVIMWYWFGSVCPNHGGFIDIDV